MTENEFEKLGLNHDIVERLKTLRIETPTQIQNAAIPVALKGQDIIGGSATGSGKTLAFAAPIIQNLKPAGFVQALVLTPTRELAEQVSGSISRYAGNKIHVLPIYGGVDIENQIRHLYNADVIVGTPGRIIDHLNRRTLSLEHVKILVLDECDRMFDMGFYQDVELIISKCPKKRQTMLFSATVSADIDHFSKKHTHSAKIISVAENVDPSKLKQKYYDVPDQLKFSLLVQLLKREGTRQLVMVFCNTRGNADFVAKNLQNNGINARVIHGGLDQKKRMRIIEDFHKKRINVLVCTDVAARGLDIKGVTHVYNYDIPKDSTEYIHRIGRTARAGREGEAINILASRDYDNFRKVMSQISGKMDIKSGKLPYINQVRIEKTFVKRRPGRGPGRNASPRGARRPMHSNRRNIRPRRISRR